MAALCLRRVLGDRLAAGDSPFPSLPRWEGERQQRCLSPTPQVPARDIQERPSPENDSVIQVRMAVQPYSFTACVYARLCIHTAVHTHSRAVVQSCSLVHSRAYTPPCSFLMPAPPNEPVHDVPCGLACSCSRGGACAGETIGRIESSAIGRAMCVGT